MKKQLEAFVFPFADDSLHSPADNFTTQYFVIGYTRGNSWTKWGRKAHNKKSQNDARLFINNKQNVL